MVDPREGIYPTKGCGEQVIVSVVYSLQELLLSDIKAYIINP